MGTQLFDQFSYLHFATGIIAYFWNIQLKHWIALHTFFEIFENSSIGMRLINQFTFWPGGKPYSNSISNVMGDTISTIIGWISARYIDSIGSQLSWYPIHIQPGIKE